MDWRCSGCIHQSDRTKAENTLQMQLSTIVFPSDQFRVFLKTAQMRTKQIKKILLHKKVIWKGRSVHTVIKDQVSPHKMKPICRHLTAGVKISLLSVIFFQKSLLFDILDCGKFCLVTENKLLSNDNIPLFGDLFKNLKESRKRTWEIMIPWNRQFHNPILCKIWRLVFVGRDGLLN